MPYSYSQAFLRKINSFIRDDGNPLNFTLVTRRLAILALRGIETDFGRKHADTAGAGLNAINPGTELSLCYDYDGNLVENAGINAMAYGLKFEWDAESRMQCFAEC